MHGTVAKLPRDIGPKPKHASPISLALNHHYEGGRSHGLAYDLRNRCRYGERDGLWYVISSEELIETHIYIHIYLIAKTAVHAIGVCMVSHVHVCFR